MVCRVAINSMETPSSIGRGPIGLKKKEEYMCFQHTYAVS